MHAQSYPLFTAHFYRQFKTGYKKLIRITVDWSFLEHPKFLKLVSFLFTTSIIIIIRIYIFASFLLLTLYRSPMTRGMPLTTSLPVTLILFWELVPASRFSNVSVEMTPPIMISSLICFLSWYVAGGEALGGLSSDKIFKETVHERIDRVIFAYNGDNKIKSKVLSETIRSFLDFHESRLEIATTARATRLLSMTKPRRWRSRSISTNTRSTSIVRSPVHSSCFTEYISIVDRWLGFQTKMDPIFRLRVPMAIRDMEPVVKQYLPVVHSQTIAFSLIYRLEKSLKSAAGKAIPLVIDYEEFIAHPKCESLRLLTQCLLTN